MYPTITDMLKDLFGIYLPLPIQTFGFFLALSFAASAYFLSKELQRKEANGLLQPSKQKFLKGESATFTSISINAIIGFFIGYKLLMGLLEYQSCSSNPQAFLLSTKGNILGGILGAGIAAFLHYREKQKSKLPKPVWVEETLHPHQHIANIVTMAAIMGILGSKIFHTLENIDELIADPMGAIFSFSGLSFFGGLILAAATIIYYAKKNNIGILPLCDAAAPSIMIAYAIGRIGCQVAGDGDWGIPNDAPMPQWLSFLPDWMWAYDYPNNVIHANLKQDFLDMGLQSITGKAWPTPFYETVMCGLLFIFLWGIRKKFSVPGMLFCIYLIVTGIERFFIEQFRINNKYHFFGLEATQAELISIALVIAGAIGLWYLNKNKQEIVGMYKTV